MSIKQEPEMDRDGNFVSEDEDSAFAGQLLKIMKTDVKDDVNSSDDSCSQQSSRDYSNSDAMQQSQTSSGLSEPQVSFHIDGVTPSSRKNSSDIWNVMVKTSPGLAMCTLCYQTFKYGHGTTNMLRHIKTKHQSIFEDTPKITQAANSNRALVAPTVNNFVGKVAKYTADSERKKTLDEKLLNFICKDMQPFTVIEGEGFRDFITELNDKYRIPSKQTLSRALHGTFDVARETLRTTLQTAEHIAITTESWSSLQGQNYLTITGHFLEAAPSWTAHSVVLATRPVVDQSAAGLSIVVTEILEEYGIQQISFAVTNNAATMVRLVKEHLKVHHIKCFGHSLNLVVKEAIIKSTDLLTVVDKVKAIVSFFHCNSKATRELKSCQNDMKTGQQELSQDVETRWTSTVQMLRRYREEHRPVCRALITLGRSDLAIPDTYIEVIQQACQILEPLEQATEEMSAEKRTSLSEVLPTVHQMREYLKNEPKSVLRDNLLTQFQKHFPNLEDDFTLSAAALLDPRFKRLPFSDKEKVKVHEDKLFSMLRPMFPSQDNEEEEEEDDTEIAPPPAKRSVWNSFDSKVKQVEKVTPPTLTGPLLEMKRYMEMGHLRRSGDPLTWWEQNCSLLPKLSILARQYLHIPATSLSPERLFSEAGEVVSARRSCLEGSAIDMVLFLNKQIE